MMVMRILPDIAKLLAALAGLFPLPALAATLTVYAAGDIGQCGSEGSELTARLLEKDAAPILALGDIAYPKGTAEDFRQCFVSTWGHLRQRIHPTPGNHDYGTAEARGYFDYFGKRAGEPGRGWYSFQLGEWHVISLNSNVDAGPGSRQLAWLKEDLARNRRRCVLAFWHHPRFSSGRHGDIPDMQTAWETLFEAGASLVLAGHDHHYERMAPLNAQGEPSHSGMRSFVVGTGGARHYRVDRRRTGSEAVLVGQWGVLKLELGPTSYAWSFLQTEGNDRSDMGQEQCRERK